MSLLATADKLVSSRKNPLSILVEENNDPELEELLFGRSKDGKWRYPGGVVLQTLTQAGLIDPEIVSESQLKHFRSRYRNVKR